MKKTQANVSDKKFETHVKAPEAKVKETKVSAKNQASESSNKRFDHHLIDQDLELEDKNGRRINPKSQEDRE